MTQQNEILQNVANDPIREKLSEITVRVYLCPHLLSNKIYIIGQYF